MSQALELNERLAEAHFSLEFMRWVYEWDWAGAELAFRRGSELPSPSSHVLAWNAIYLVTMGRFDEAVSIAKRAVDNDPLSPMTYNALSASYWHAGNRKQAYEQIRRGLELDPEFRPNVATLANYYAEEGRYNDAIRESQKLLDRGLHHISTAEAGLIGWIYGLSDRRTEASRILDELNRRTGTEKVAAFQPAAIYLAMGDEERSLELLEKGYENREAEIVWLKVIAVVDPLRDQPRFQTLLKRMNFP